MKNRGIEVLTDVAINKTVLQNVLPYSLVEIYQSLEETYCSPFQGRIVNLSLLMAEIPQALRPLYGFCIEPCLVTRTRRQVNFLSTDVTPFLERLVGLK